MLTCVSLCFAGTTGRLMGRVRDKGGKGIPNVYISVSNDSTWSCVTKCNEKSVYKIMNVPPGIYTVKFSKDEYNEHTVTGVRVNVDLATTLNATLIKKDDVQTGIIINAQQTPPSSIPQNGADLNTLVLAELPPRIPLSVALDKANYKVTYSHMWSAFRNRKTGKLVGVVRNQKGKRLEDAYVTIIKVGSYILSTGSNKNGTFQINNLSEGEYKVQIRRDRYYNADFSNISIKKNIITKLNVVINEKPITFYDDSFGHNPPKKKKINEKEDITGSERDINLDNYAH
jgi:uncharacterized membrane protein